MDKHLHKCKYDSDVQVEAFSHVNAIKLCFNPSSKLRSNFPNLHENKTCSGNPKLAEGIWAALDLGSGVEVETGKAGAGGLFRNSNGHWLCGFARNIGYTTSVCAELWALRDGLSIASNRGYQNLIVEVNSQVVLRYVSEGVSAFHSHFVVVHDCKLLLQRLGNARMVHAFREANSCTDGLAQLGTDLEDHFVLFDLPPVNICNELLADSMGITFPRELAL